MNLEANLTSIFSSALLVALERNRRYATERDPLSNFRPGGEYGIAVRLSDKVSRLLNLTRPGNTLDDAGESIEDTCIDMINYAALLIVMRGEDK